MSDKASYSPYKGFPDPDGVKNMYDGMSRMGEVVDGVFDDRMKGEGGSGFGITDMVIGHEPTEAEVRTLRERGVLMTSYREYFINDKWAIYLKPVEDLDDNEKRFIDSGMTYQQAHNLSYRIKSLKEEGILVIISYNHVRGILTAKVTTTPNEMWGKSGPADTVIDYLEGLDNGAHLSQTNGVDGTVVILYEENHRVTAYVPSEFDYCEHGRTEKEVLDAVRADMQKRKDNPRLIIRRPSVDGSIFPPDMAADEVKNRRVVEKRETPSDCDCKGGSD